MKRGKQTIIIKPVAAPGTATRDWQGDLVEGGPPEPDPRTVTGCFVLPRKESETSERIIAGKQVIMFPPHEPPDERDRVEYDGDEYDIDGAVGPYPKAGRDVAYEFYLERVT